MPVLPTRTALAAALAIALGAAASTHASAVSMVTAAQPSIDAVDAARANPNLIILRAGVFDPAAQQLDMRDVGAAAVSASAYAIVQFQPGQLSQRKALLARGVEFLGYVPNNAYYVRLNGVSLDEVAQTTGVRSANVFTPALKLDPGLWSSRRIDSAARQYDGRYEIQIDAFAGVSSANVAAALEKTVPGVQITQRSERADAAQYVRASVSLGQLDALVQAATAIEGVAFVSPWLQPHTMNAGAVGAIQGNAAAACAGSGAVCGPTPMWDHNLFGSGQVVAISDSGTDANEAWFTTLDKGAGAHEEITFADAVAPVLPAIGTLHPANKILAYWVQPGATAYDNNKTCPGGTSPTSWHGTHTSGTLVGDAAGTFGGITYLASSPTSAGHDLADGMAPNAQLIQQDIGDDNTGCLQINDLRGTLEQAVAGGAHIHSDSWGASNAGAYGGNDNDVDYATNTLEDLLFVVAAGNDGAAQTIGSPGNAKNALTVGALGHAGSKTIASFSSRGPTADGRQKPDIMAPGSSTISAAGDSSTTSTIEAPVSKSLSGTSMATPTIAGNAVLMRQFFADGFYPRGAKTSGDAYNASGMAMKAVLLNGTDTLAQATWPNNNYGWGRAWLDGNLWFANTMTGGDDSRRMRLFERTNAAGLETGDAHEYTLANVAAGTEFRVTLTWFDPEASVGAAATLVNNLDLEVVGPGSTYKGNVLTAGVSTTGGNADSKNTVEQVRLTAPVAGSYTLRVKGSSIPGNGRPQTDRQGYALVASGNFGLPDQAPFAAPTGLAIAGNDTTGVKVAFSAASGAQGFQLYRANGTCASAAPGDFRLVANGASAPLVDHRSQGGFSYAYKVRGISNDVEGQASGCIDVVSADTCTLLPAFDTASLLAKGSSSSCSVDLAWHAAPASCPTATGVTYTIKRDTDPYLGTAQTIASAVATAAYADATVSNGTPYYYQVSATDSFGNQSQVSQVRNVTPSGVDGPDPKNYIDNVDTHSYMTMQSPWRITNVSASDGVYSYHNTPDGQPYPDLTCASITTPALTLPANASLNFMARYDMEYQWDGVVQEISTDGGTTWNDLPPTGGYPTTFAQTMNPPINACGFASTHGAFSGVSTSASNANPNNGSATAVFKPFAANLAAYAGQTVQIRWRMSSDPASGYLGFLLDQVTIGDGSGGSPTDVVFANGFEEGSTPDYMCH